MGRSHDLSEVRLLQQSLEEGIGVTDAILLNQCWIRSNAIPPVQCQPTLASALDQEQDSCSQTGHSHTTVNQDHHSCG